ncbi:MAG: hypothetical protein AAGG07_05985 [Planctomycetota bacterium]
MATTSAPGGGDATLQEGRSLEAGPLRLSRERGASSTAVLRFAVPVGVRVDAAELRLDLVEGYGRFETIVCYGVDESFDNQPVGALASVVESAAAGSPPLTLRPLGAARLVGKGGRLRYTDHRLGEFLASDTNGLVTLILQRASLSAAPLTLASEEDTWFNPPTLRLNLAGGSSAREIRRQASVPARIEAAWAALNGDAWKRGWSYALDDHDLFMNADGAGDDPLVAMLSIEAAFRAGRLDDRTWAERLAARLRAHPDASGRLVEALLELADARLYRFPSPQLSRLDSESLLREDLPESARAVLTRRAVLASDLGSMDASSRVIALQRFIPYAFGRTSEPWLLAAYLEALTEARGLSVSLAFAAHASELLEDPQLKRVASLFRLAREPDPDRRSELIADAARDVDGGSLAKTVAPLYLDLMARNGRILEAASHLELPVGAGSVEAVFDAFEARAFGAEQAVFADLDERLTPQLGAAGVCLELADALWRSSRYADAGAVGTSLLRSLGSTAPDPAPVNGSGDPNRMAALTLGIAHERFGSLQAARMWYSIAAGASEDTVASHAAARIVLIAMLDGAMEFATDMIDRGTPPIPNDVADIVRRESARADRSGMSSDLERINDLIVRARGAPGPEQSAELYFEAARIALELQQLEGALYAYEAFALDHPDAPDAGRALARSIRILDRWGGPGADARAQRLRDVLLVRAGPNAMDTLIDDAESDLPDRAIEPFTGMQR